MYCGRAIKYRYENCAGDHINLDGDGLPWQPWPSGTARAIKCGFSAKGYL